MTDANCNLTKYCRCPIRKHHQLIWRRAELFHDIRTTNKSEYSAIKMIAFSRHILFRKINQCHTFSNPLFEIKITSTNIYKEKVSQATEIRVKCTPAFIRAKQKSNSGSISMSLLDCLLPFCINVWKDIYLKLEGIV